MNTTNAGERKLTDARITEISRAHRNSNGLLLNDLSFARAIESELANAAPAGDCSLCGGNGKLAPSETIYGMTCPACDGSKNEPAPAGAVPEGWKLVPVKMDDNMWRAWNGQSSALDTVEMESIYAAVLAAAPEPKGGEV